MNILSRLLLAGMITTTVLELSHLNAMQKSDLGKLANTSNETGEETSILNILGNADTLLNFIKNGICTPQSTIDTVKKCLETTGKSLCDIMDSEFNEQTILHLACRNGDHCAFTIIIKIALDLRLAKKLILQHGFLDMTALHWATENGHREIVAELLNTSANLGIAHKVIHAYGFGCRTALWYAIINNHKDIVTLLNTAEKK